VAFGNSSNLIGRLQNKTLEYKAVHPVISDGSHKTDPVLVLTHVKKRKKKNPTGHATRLGFCKWNANVTSNVRYQIDSEYMGYAGDR